MEPDDIEAWLNEAVADGLLSRRERSRLAARLRDACATPDDRRQALRTGFAIARQSLGETGRGPLEIAERIALAALDGAERPAPTIAEVHFSPGSDCRDRVVALLDQTRRSADLCMYTLTDDRIADAVRRIHDRGVRVRIVSEEDKALDAGSDVLRLRRTGIEVRFEATPALMHHKFAVLDGWIVVSGSYNWTRSAGSDNHENIIVSSDPALVAPFAERFRDLWSRFGKEDRPGLSS